MESDFLLAIEEVFFTNYQLLLLVLKSQDILSRATTTDVGIQCLLIWAGGIAAGGLSVSYA